MERKKERRATKKKGTSLIRGKEKGRKTGGRTCPEKPMIPNGAGRKEKDKAPGPTR